MQIVIDISKEKYDEIMSMDWVNCRLFFDEELRAIHDGKVLEPCGDCISRQAAIDALTKTSGIRGDSLKALYDLPPVTPAGKVGHWIDHQMDIWIYAKCSECETIHDTRTNYCPHCGAKMQEVENG